MKKWLLIGGGLALTIAAILGLRKEEDKHDKKIQKMISDVDMKKPKEEVKTVEELSSDVDSAISGMDIDGDEAAEDLDVEEVIKQGYSTLKKAHEMLDDSETNRKKAEELAKKIEKLKNDPEYLEAETKKREAEREERFKTTWITDVEAAVKAKNYSKLEDLFDEKYAGGPWHPSPASVFANAKADGMIDDATMRGAEKYFGRLWNYSGD